MLKNVTVTRKVAIERVAIVGSRHYPDRKAVEDYINSLSDDTVIVSGGARGVDTWAELAAGRRGLRVVVHRPNWGKHGKMAGPNRNTNTNKN